VKRMRCTIRIIPNGAYGEVRYARCFGLFQQFVSSLVSKGWFGVRGASVVEDTFKDTAGPLLHVLIKLLATIMLVLAPRFI
jgi:hypothetical protein